MANFKKISDVTLVDAVQENDSVLGERDGAAVRIPAGALGGGLTPVNVYYDETADKYSASATYAQVLEMIYSGKSVVLMDDGFDVYHLVQMPIPNGITKYMVFAKVGNNSGDLSWQGFKYRSDNLLTYDSYTIASGK